MKAVIQTTEGGVSLILDGEAKGTMSLECAIAAIRKADQQFSDRLDSALEDAGMDDGIGVEVRG